MQIIFRTFETKLRNGSRMKWENSGLVLENLTSILAPHLSVYNCGRCLVLAILQVAMFPPGTKLDFVIRSINLSSQQLNRYAKIRNSLAVISKIQQYGMDEFSISLTRMEQIQDAWLLKSLIFGAGCKFITLQEIERTLVSRPSILQMKDFI